MSALAHCARLLIVEDEYLVARYLCRVIRDIGGAPIGPVPSVTHARAELARHVVDLALLDIKLAQGNVYPLADELAANGTPIVFVTGYDGGLLPERFAGHALLEKPITQHELAHILETVERRGDTPRT